MTSGDVLSRHGMADVGWFCTVLDDLESRVGGKRLLATCDGKVDWPCRGVYFFFEPGEERSGSGVGPRVVRVGTHALTQNNQTRLWDRLRQHRGFLSGKRADGGNHRGSIFRKHIGMALIARDNRPADAAETWGAGSTATSEILDQEAALERAVSQHIRSMPFLWVAVDDTPGPGSDRGMIERNAIAMLAGARVDPPSSSWLGLWARSEAIQRSELWNVNHIGEGYDPRFLQVLQDHVKAMH